MGWLIGIAIVSAIGGLIFGGISASNEQERLDIEKEKLNEQRNSDYRSALSTLDTMKSNFDALMKVTIPQLEGEISAVETDIGLWDKRYAQETGEIQAKIDTVDDLIGNWQMSYDAQTKSAKEQGKNTFSQLLANWSDAEVMAADRGMGGSMSLVAEQQKQRAIAYAGDDLSLGGTDGIFGASYASLLAGLASERSQYDTQKSLLAGSLDLTQISLQNELESWTTTLGNKQQALEMNRESLADMLGGMEKQLNVIEDKYSKLSNKDNSITDARNLLKEYRKYL